MKIWNEALLYVGGYLARAIYEYELSMISQTPNQELRGLYATRFFGLKESAPDSRVSEKIREAFFGCSLSPLSIMSSNGVLPVSEVRLYDPDCASFMKKIPILPSHVSDAADGMMPILKSQGLRTLNFSDLMEELTEERVLKEQEMVACLKWILKTSRITGANRKTFLTAVKFSCEGSDHVVSLSTISKVVGDDGITLFPLQSRLAPHTLPYSISKHLPIERLIKLFPWTKLSIIDWLDDMVSLRIDSDFTAGSSFARQVFEVLSGAWSSLLEEERDRVRIKLQAISCIPTTLGMRRPQETYLYDPAIASFLDVPMVNPNGAIPESARMIVSFPLFFFR